MNTNTDDINDLFEEYLEYVDSLRDSAEHKLYMINSDRCFFEWVEEITNKDNN